LNPEWNHWVAKGNGDIDYERSPNSGGLSLIPGKGRWHAFPLDHFNIQKCNLIKVDTQGSDLRVLKGGAQTIDRCRPKVIFEFEHNGSGRNASGDTLEDCKFFFSRMGYIVTCIHDNGMGWSDYLATPQEKAA
jgi:hypothetical protein